MPISRILNFQKFKILTIPIVITVVLLFIFLIANLVIRITYKLNTDFCMIMEDGKTIPSAEFGISSATVVPTLCFAFGFQIYMLQVHKVLDRPDPNGHRGMKIGLSTLTIMLFIYGGLLLLTVAYQEPHDKQHIIYIYDVIFNAIREFEFFAQVVVIIQLFCHTPFVFYIAREQVLMFVDEYQRQSMSKMIDEQKLVSGKQKRYLTQELKDEDNNQITVMTYRLPYMTMPRKQ